MYNERKTKLSNFDKIAQNLTLIKRVIFEGYLEKDRLTPYAL